MSSGLFSVADYTDKILFFILGIDVFLLTAITALMVYFVFRYSRRKNSTPAQIEGNVKLEIIWTVIPTILVMVMFFYGWKGYLMGRKIPEDAMLIKTTARKWSWSFEYSNGKITDTLYIPVNKPIKIELKTEDVVHNFFAPAFKVKIDAMPGKLNTLWFQSSREGTYDLLCAEYCGTMHSQMKTKIKAISGLEFDSWIVKDVDIADTDSGLSSQEGDEQVQFEPNPKKGAKVYRRLCASCHSLDGKIVVGPTFKELWGREETVLSDDEERTIKVDENYIRKMRKKGENSS